MKALFLLCLLSGMVFNVYSQNGIYGKITDDSGSSLTGAAIFIPELNKGVISDAQGNFYLSNLPDGEYRLQVSFLGFRTAIQLVHLNGSKLQIDFIMIQSPVEGEEIVISGGTSSTQHDNTVKIDVLKLKDPGMITNPNFSASLQKIPGLDMISKGSGVSKPVIRGLSMNDILVLNNGVRFENYQYSSHHPLGIDEFGIEEIEVIKGPASLLYGSDAIGGVLNFIKEKPAPRGMIKGDYTMQLFSNTLGITNNLGLKGSSDKFYAGLRVGQKSNSDFLQGGGDYAPNSRFNENSINADAGYSGARGTINIYYDYYKQKLGLVEDDAINEISVRDRKNKIYYQDLGTHLLSTQNKLFFGKMKLDINTSFQSTELAHVAGENIYELQMRLATLIYETKVHLPSRSNAGYIFGVQGTNQFNRNLNSRETILLPNANINNYSVFVMLQQGLQKWLKVQTGIRYDSKEISTKAVGKVGMAGYRMPVDKQYNSFSGSAGAIINLGKASNLRTNLAAAYRTPNLAELTSDGQHETIYEKGNQNLLPENSFESDISLHIHKNNFTFDVAAFYNYIRNYIFISPTNDIASNGIPVYQYLQVNSTLFGGEAGFHLHPKDIDWMHFQSTFASVIGKQSNDMNLPFIPAFKLNIEVRAEKESLGKLRNAFIGINTNTAFDQDRPAPNETATVGYTLLNIGIGANINISDQSVYLSLNADNLFDKKYIDHLSTLKEVNLYNPGRNLSLTIKIPFTVKKKAKV